MSDLDKIISFRTFYSFRFKLFLRTNFFFRYSAAAQWCHNWPMTMPSTMSFNNQQSFHPFQTLSSPQQAAAAAAMNSAMNGVHHNNNNNIVMPTTTIPTGIPTEMPTICLKKENKGRSIKKIFFY